MIADRRLLIAYCQALALNLQLTEREGLIRDCSCRFVVEIFRD